MEQSDDEDQPRIPEQASLIEEALRILNEEGFTLPNDVVDTLETVGRTNARGRGRPLRSHRVCEVQSSTRRMRNAREATRRGSQSDASSDEERVRSERPPDPESQSTTSGTCEGSNGSDNDSNVGKKSESEFSSESSSTCTASTVREVKGHERMPLTRQDSGSSLASSASSYNRKLAQLDDGRSSHGSDTGYNTSLENAMQVHEARADNLKNYTKHMENKLSEKERMNNGLRREMSHDSGFTEPCDAASGSRTPGTPTAVSPSGNDTRDFKDISVSNSDIKERMFQTEQGAAHQITSSASNLTAAEMTQRCSKVTEDGTAVSTSAKLENQETTSTLSKATDTLMADQVKKEEEHQTENRRTKSSRNDTIATSASGVTTSGSRHAVSMDQELNKEKASMTVSSDGRRLASEMEMTQQLAREQEMNNIEQSDDGSSKSENKKISEKAAMSKSHREEQMTSEDGLTTGVISGSQHQETNARACQSEESSTSPDGTVSKRKLDSSSSSESQRSSIEQKTVKQLPYSGASSTEVVKKSDSSTSSKSSTTMNQITEGSSGRSEMSKLEDSNSASSSFSGLCESTDVVNGVKIQRSKTSDQSCESKMKSSKTSSSYSIKSSDGYDDRSVNRRLSNSSNASTLSNMSGLSRENIKPPSYEETVNNLSRQSSLLSRQDSCGSSIASSASALNEQMRQKRLADAETERSSLDSQTRLKQVVDSNYDRRNPSYNRQGSYSSDSTLSGGVTNNVYENVDGADYFDEITTSTQRIINHPVRKVETYTRSATDPTIRDRVPSRRYTLHGDVVLSERELAEARESVRAKVRGQDDIYLGGRSDDSSSERSYGSMGRNRRRREASSFEREVMELVDKFFDEDDDGFGFGFTSGRKTSAKEYSRRVTAPELTSDYRPSSTRSHQNPYSTREDLSAFVHRDDSTNSRRSPDYPASDSCYPVGRRYGGGYHSSREEVLDTASEGGYNRFSHHSRDSRGDRFIPSDSYSHDIGSPRRRPDNQYQFSDPDSRHKTYAASACDNLHRTGRSINGDRHISSSISEGNRRGEFALASQVRNNGHQNTSDGNIYKRYTEDALSDRYESDMSDVSSTCPSFRSLPPDAYRMNQFDPEEYRTQSLPDISDGKLPKDDPRMGTRKERIDTALSWIRSELGHLRTQDKVLMSQFQRCQDSIEQLKKQRPWYEVFSDEEGEDGRHWEDWEIDDFDRSCESEPVRESPRRPAPEPKTGTVITKEYQRMSIKSLK